MTDSVRAATDRLAKIGRVAQDHLTVQREALSVVRQVVPFDIGSFATVDPATLLWTSCVIHGLDNDPARETFMFDNEYRQEDLLKVSELARRTVPAGRLSAIDAQVRSRSTRYHVIRSYGAGDELRCAIVDQGNCWASFEIYRGRESASFTDQDVENAALLVPSLARLVRLALLRRAAARPTATPDPPGVVVLEREGSIEAMSPASQRWFEEIDPHSTVPPVIRALVMRLTGGNEDEISMVVPRNTGGWLRLHATLLLADGDSKVSIVLEPVKPAVLSPTIARAYSFTPRESEVITLMARGLSSKEIGDRLGISAFTVNDHSKAIFQKAGVQSKQQLIAELFFDHCLPMRQRNAIPGPYGWFLDEERVQDVEQEQAYAESGAGPRKGAR